jgi:LemA protein
LYNAAVNEFNEMLYIWPNNVVAASKKLYNAPLFAATAEDRKDVSLKIEE